MTRRDRLGCSLPTSCGAPWRRSQRSPRPRVRRSSPSGGVGVVDARDRRGAGRRADRLRPGALLAPSEPVDVAALASGSRLEHRRRARRWQSGADGDPTRLRQAAREPRRQRPATRDARRRRRHGGQRARSCSRCRTTARASLQGSIRSPEARATAGSTGYGLWLARAIAEAHGGSLELVGTSARARASGSPCRPLPPAR